MEKNLSTIFFKCIHILLINPKVFAKVGKSSCIWPEIAWKSPEKRQHELTNGTAEERYKQKHPWCQEEKDLP